MTRRLIAMLALLLAEPASAAWVCASPEWMYSAACVQTPHPVSGVTGGFTTLDCPGAGDAGEFTMPIPPGNLFRYRYKVQYMTPDEAADQYCKFNGILVSTINYCTGGTSGNGEACRQDVATCAGNGECGGGTGMGDTGSVFLFANPGLIVDGPTLTHDSEARYWTATSATREIYRFNGSTGVACSPGVCTGVSGMFWFSTNISPQTASTCNIAQVCVEMF